MWAMKFFSEDVNSIYARLGADTRYVSECPAIYQCRYTSLPQMVRHTMDSLIENKWLTPKS